MSHEHPVYELLRRIRMDTTAIQAKLTDAFEMLSDLNLNERARPTCDRCGLTFPGTAPLNEHRYHTHNGPEPAHWLAIEARSDEHEQADAA